MKLKPLVRPLLILVCLACGGLHAQPAGPSPLTPATAAEQTVPGHRIVAEQRADQALQTGFPATAAAFYREILTDRTTPAETRQRVGLALVTALLDAGEISAAEAALQAYDGPRHSPYQLRLGLVAANARRLPQAKAALAAGRVEELSAPDRGWWYFLQANVADLENDLGRAGTLYGQAVGAAVSALQRARFDLGQEQFRLRSGTVTEARLAELRGNMERLGGSRLGYTAVRAYAAALAGLGRAGDAQVLLQTQLAVLPATERDAADQLRIMLGLIAGDGSAAGRQAFRELVRGGQTPDTQRLALQLLVRGARTPAEREQLRRELSDLIGAPTQNPIIEDLLLERAQAALEDKAYAQAEEDARALMDRYPATTLRPAALGVRLAVAWELKRYRAAADVIAQLRAVLGPGRERAELGVLMAEAFFRAEDYRNAADAYEAARLETPRTVPVGVLIFQRVLSEIRAERLEAAAQLLNAAAGDVDFDPVHRWQAEWNLVREMQVKGGQEQAAQARVERLLAAGTQGVREDLRIRLLWLRAQLSFDNGQAEAALRQSDELLAALAAPGALEPALLTEVASTTRLLKAKALLALGRDDEGIKVLDALRTEFHATAAAESSYLVQAGHLRQREDLAGAQRVLINFVDTPEYKKSAYAPVALYEAALLLEQQGLDRHLREANDLLERLISSYPADALVFYARLRQGDLLRRLNDFSNARLVYEFLLNNYAGHPDELLAQLALANCLFAQGASVANYESAAAIFERLRDLPSAPVDLRAEAGFDWGYALAKRAAAAKSPAERDAQLAKAVAVYWSVVNDFLLNPTSAVQLGAKGRRWVSRALLELGQIHEDAGRLDEAQRAYQLIVDNKLGGIAMAQAKLARYRPAAGGAP